MALPRQLPTTHDGGPLTGPFISSGGAAYYVAKDDSAIAVDVLKTSDPSSAAFSAQDTADNPTTAGGTTTIRGTTALVDLDARQVGDVIHIAILSRTVPAMGDWEVYWDYATYNMATDQWVAPSDGSVNSTAFTWDGTDVTSGQIRIMVRGNDGDIVIVGGGTVDTAKGTDYSTIYHAFFNGSTWSTPTRIDTATSEVNYSRPAVSNDYTTDGDYVAAWKSGTSGEVDGRAVTAGTHVHETVGAVGSTSPSGFKTPSTDLIVYNDGGTWRGSLLRGVGTGTQIDAYRFDPTSSTPFASETAETDITGSDNPFLASSSSEDIWVRQAYDSSTDTRYCIYVVAGTPDSIKYVTSVNEATWGGATTFSTPANDTRLPWGHATVGTSPSDGSSTVIGFLYYDATGGQAYYDEIVISAGGLSAEITDGADFGDSPDVAIATAIADGVDLSDAPTTQTDYNQSLADGVDLSDAADAKLIVPVSDGIDLSDDVATQADFNQSLADGVDLSDSLAIQTDFHQSVTDGVDLSDTPVTQADFNQSLSDGIDLSDDTTLSVGVDVADGVDLSDDAAFTDVERSVSDGVDLSDTAVGAIGVSESDGVDLSDTPATQSDFNQALTDGVDLSDAADATLIVPVQDGVDLSDTVTTQSDFNQSVADGIDVSDVPAVQVDFNQSVSDGIDLSDAPAFEDVARAAADGVDLSDTPATQVDFNQSLSDGVDLSDATDINVGVAESDGIDLSDSVATQLDYNQSATDGAKFSDAASYPADNSRAAVDGVDLSDTAAARADANQSLTDGVAAGDATNVAVATSASDGVDLSDAATARTASDRALTDGVDLSDTVTYDWAAGALVVDGVDLTDLLLTLARYVGPVSDGVLLSDDVAGTVMPAVPRVYPLVTSVTVAPKTGTTRNVSSRLGSASAAASRLDTETGVE